MSFRLLLELLKARWQLALGLLIVTVATTVTISLLMSKTYSATASVVLDVKSPDPISGSVMPGMLTASYMATQLDIIKSSKTMLKVIGRLGLDRSPQVREQWTATTGGQGDFNAWLTDLLLRGLDVRPSKESNVINVTFSGSDPNFAAAVANSIVESYQLSLLELRSDPAKQFSEFFEEQASQTRQRLLQAQTALSEFQQKNGIVASDERIDVESNRLNDLSSQLVAVQGISADSRGRATNSGDNSPDVITNPVVSALKADVARAESRQMELTARLGQAHPVVQEQMAAIKELRGSLQREISNVRSSLTVNDAVNRSRENEIRLALEAQREKVLQMKQLRDSASVLLQDVGSAQRAYDMVQAKQAQTYIESQNSQTNVGILKKATAPAKHSSPSLLINSILALILGVLFSVGVVVAMEFSDRRLRTSEDISDILNLPLIGSIDGADRGRKSEHVKQNQIPALLSQK